MVNKLMMRGGWRRKLKLVTIIAVIAIAFLSVGQKRLLGLLG